MSVCLVLACDVCAFADAIALVLSTRKTDGPFVGIPSSRKSERSQMIGRQWAWFQKHGRCVWGEGRVCSTRSLPILSTPKHARDAWPEWGSVTSCMRAVQAIVLVCTWIIVVTK